MRSGLSTYIHSFQNLANCQMERCDICNISSSGEELLSSKLGSLQRLDMHFLCLFVSPMQGAYLQRYFVKIGKLSLASQRAPVTWPMWWGHMTRVLTSAGMQMSCSNPLTGIIMKYFTERWSFFSLLKYFNNKSGLFSRPRDGWNSMIVLVTWLYF